MNTLRQVIRRLLRGPRACAMLERLGIDARRFWLLTDLFGELSERAEILDNLGRNGMALKTAAWMYFAMSALMSFLAVAAQPPLLGFSGIVLLLTGILLLMVLLMETANSLVNPVEAGVLAHQPISGATYTAAKLTHLATIVLYLVTGLNLVPALAGLTLKGAPWFYPLAHMAAALALGFALALACCALFGWLIRLLPPRRLKAIAQLVAVLPFLFMVLPQSAGRWFGRLHLERLLPAQTEWRVALAVAAAAVVAAVLVLGIRSLSTDYLIRVSAITRGGPAGRRGLHRSWLGGIVGRWFGGPAARAGSAFTSIMMRRDWQFRRQLIPMGLPALVGLVPMLVKGWRVDPFLGPFSFMHLLPHVAGAVLFMVCFVLPYGNDYKGSWIFLLAPSRAVEGFARGVYALLWIVMVVLPHAVLLPFLAASWGVWHAALFIAYSTAAASLYLALELRLIEGAPFSSQMDNTRGSIMLPTMIVGGLAIGAAVAVQYFVIFRSPFIVMAVAAGTGAGAWAVTRRSMAAFAGSIRYRLALASAETGRLYKEIA